MLVTIPCEILGRRKSEGKTDEKGNVRINYYVNISQLDGEEVSQLYVKQEIYDQANFKGEAVIEADFVEIKDNTFLAFKRVVSLANKK